MEEQNQTQKEVVVAVSGYFNPVHKGHINLFKEAKALGDKLVVILNNNKQVKLKGSFPFMSPNDRKAVIEAIGYVDEVVMSIDEDRTVCKTLAIVKPDIFANGGDRKEAMDIPEADVCRQLGIKMVFNVGGGKVQSSSWLIDKARGRVLNKDIPEEKLSRLKMLVLDSDGVCIPRGTNIKEKEDGATYMIEFSTGMLSWEMAEKINQLKKHLLVCIASGRSLMYLQTVYSRIVGTRTVLLAENGNLALVDGKITQLFDYDDRYFEKMALIRNNLKHLEISGFEPKQFILTAHAQTEVPSVYDVVQKIDEEKDIKVMWNGEAFDIMSRQVSKGAGLEKLLAVLGIRKEEVIAIGDRLNDEELVKTAGIGVSADIENLKADYWTTNEQLAGGVLVRYLFDYFENL